MIRRGPEIRLLAAAAAVYAAADFMAALGGDIGASIPGGGEPALVIVPFCTGFAVCFLAWGRFADRTGAGRAIVGSLAGVAAAGVLVAVAGSIPMLLTGRVLQGAAAAGLPPAAQAILAARGGPSRAGRSIGSLMIVVAVSTTLGPVAAGLLAGPLGWRGAVVVLGVVLPAALAAWISLAGLGAGPQADDVPRARPAALRPSSPLLAGCAVSALVLGGYWTLLTRMGEVLGGDGLGLPAGAAALLPPVAATLGIVLVVVSAAATDRRGPRVPMVAVLGAGAAAAALAASGVSPAISAAALIAVLALYWSYLPVVSVQVARSAPDDVRATALASLYTSMWLGAAVFGALAAIAPGWRELMAGTALLWLAAAAVAARGFHPGPAAA